MSRKAASNKWSRAFPLSRRADLHDGSADRVARAPGAASPRRCQHNRREQFGGSASPESKELRERLEDAQWQRELLEKSRAEKVEELAKSRARLAHLEEHAQRLEARRGSC